MREILFRGKDTSGKWHYGVPLMFNEDYVCIAKLNEHNKTVEYKTLGQYTGLTDKNELNFICVRNVLKNFNSA